MRLSNKLDFTKLKSFRIAKVLKLVMYNLDLLDNIRITKIRHISVLKLVDPEAPFIKDILDICYDHNGICDIQYLVRAFTKSRCGPCGGLLTPLIRAHGR